MSSTDTLVTYAFPEDTQPHTLIYYDRSLRTINDGVRMLHRISNPILRLHQQLPIQNLFLDRSYEGHIRHNEEQGILTITIPSECIAVGGIRNNKSCKMVTYYRNKENGYVKEIQLSPDHYFDTKNHEVKITIYTQHHRNLIVSFDVFLVKPKALICRL
jgi:hypothetical protein